MVCEKDENMSDRLLQHNHKEMEKPRGVVEEHDAVYEEQKNNISDRSTLLYSRHGNH